MIENLIFDFDGTVSDSYPVFVRIVRKIAEDRGFVIDRTDEQLMELLMVNVKTCFTELHFDYPGRVEAFWHYQSLFYKDFKPFPEIESILKKAIALGKRNYIYTHSGDVVLRMLENMGLDGYFADVLTSSKGFLPKPAPDALLYLCKTRGLAPDTCMMIGDRSIDTQAGRNAGMQGCLWDAFDRYPDEQVTYRIKTLKELDALLERI